MIGKPLSEKLSRAKFLRRKSVLSKFSQLNLMQKNFAWSLENNLKTKLLKNLFRKLNLSSTK